MTSIASLASWLAVALGNAPVLPVTPDRTDGAAGDPSAWAVRLGFPSGWAMRETVAQAPGERRAVWVLGPGAAPPGLGRGSVALSAGACEEGPPGTWSSEFRLDPGPGSQRARLTVRAPSPPQAALARLSTIERLRQGERPTGALGPEAGRLLYALAIAVGARRALEVGTGEGAAALWLAAAISLGGGRLVTVERDSRRGKIARSHLREAGLYPAVECVLGDFDRVLSRLGGGYDFVLLDAEPADRLDQLTALLQRCAPGAVVVSRGAVARAAELARYQALVRSHPRIGADLVVGADDGLGLAVLVAGRG